MNLYIHNATKIPQNVRSNAPNNKNKSSEYSNTRNK